MDELLNQQFQRVETALNTLIESITSYNPSPAAAIALVAADDELSKGLEKLATHQANYARIQSLRRTAEALDNEVKSAISTLADTRKELVNTPATVFTEASRDIPFDELLSYAKRISRYTVPPTFRPPPPKEDGEPDATANSPVPKVQNGTTPAAIEGDPHAASAPPATEEPEKKPEEEAVYQLSEVHKNWLDTTSNTNFLPWPHEDSIRRGALAQIQAMVERGEDPAKVLTPEEQAEADKRAAEEKREKEEAEERERLRREEWERKRMEEMEKRRRESIRPHDGGASQQDSGGFGDFELYNPDDD